MNIFQLSTSEKILLAGQLCESVRAEAANDELITAQRQELDNRLAAFEIDQDVGDSWDAVKNRITSL